jgi:hypothetical protein
MLRWTAAACLLALAACNPTFNWREVRAEPTTLKALLPCKPDEVERDVSMGAGAVKLHALGCETGGATFAVMNAELADPSLASERLAQWKTATLANMHGTAAREEPFRPPGALALPGSVKVVAAGRGADGHAIASQAAYFSQGRHVFQAVIYAEQIKPETAEAFFSGLRFE